MAMMTCPTCATPAPADAQFCQRCGTALLAAPPPPPPPPGSPGYGDSPGDYSGYASTPPGYPGYGGPPAGPPQDIRNIALLGHLSAFAGAIVALAFLGPLVVWLTQRDRHPFIAEHAKEALNFNISVLIYAVVSFLLTFVLIGFVLLPAVGLLWLVCTIVAAVKAANGEWYRYPLNIRFVS